MTRTRGATPHLFTQWDLLVQRIRDSKRLVMFLDFDGTLVPIASLPERVRLEQETRVVLKRLASHRNVTLAVISGRQRTELQRLVGIRTIDYLGLYGWENNGNARMPLPVRLVLVRALISLTEEFAAYPDVWIEPKHSSFSIHLMGTSSETRRRVRRAVQTRIAPLRNTLRVLTNLRDMEVLPLSLGDKGVAVRRILAEPAHRGALAIYFGDDFSDEPAFAAAGKGIPILVGRRRATRARFYLRGPAEVASALSRVEAILR